MSKVSIKEITRLLVKHSGNKSAVARELGVNRWKVWEAVKRHGKFSSAKRTDKTTSDNEVILTYQGEEWKDPDALIKESGLDMKLWRVDSIQERGWEVTGKVKRGQKVTKVGTTHKLAWLPEEIWKSNNRYIAIRLVRRAPVGIQDGIKLLLEEVKPPKPLRPPQMRGGDSHVMEVSPYDAHFGKVAWGAQTGEDFDLKICDFDFRHAVDDLLQKTGAFKVSKIVIPLGHDFYNVNNWLGTTAAGTAVESVDDRFPKVWRKGCRASQYMVESCLKVAPVEVLWVPGNHDPETSFYLCEWLSAIFSNNKHVVVDCSLLERKYRRYGVNQFGYIHGDPTKQPKDNDLPLLMASEDKANWASCEWHQWRMGHWHKRSLKKYVTVVDTFQGVEVVRMPSLTAADDYHYRNGYTGNHRTAEAWLYHKQDGYAGHFSTNAWSGRKN